MKAKGWSVLTSIGHLPERFQNEGGYGEVSASTSTSSAITAADILSSSLNEDRYDEEMNDHDGVDEANDDEHLRE